jgi:hypothetical protein
MGKSFSEARRLKQKLKYISKGKKRQYNNDLDTLDVKRNVWYSCHKKKRYNGTAEVIWAGRRNYEIYGMVKKLFYYSCKQCNGYHLTHRPGTDSVEIRNKELDR